eukprot:scaffold6992_cov151-Skeletonema_menzelii.AAC.1
MSLLSRPHIQFAIHLMTTMKNQAVAISAKLKSKGLSSEWQTSEDSNTSRINKMSDWTDGLVKKHLVGGLRLAANAIQSIGRGLEDFVSASSLHPKSTSFLFVTSNDLSNATGTKETLERSW